MRGYLENFAAYYSALYDFTEGLCIAPFSWQDGAARAEGMGMRLATKIVRVPFYLISVCNGKLFQSVHLIR